MNIIKSGTAPLHGAAISTTGGRPENQDDMAFLDTPLGFLAIVCDGMGGGPGGKTASYIAKHEIAETLCECSPQTPRDQALKKAAARAQQALEEKTKEMPALSGMGSTFVAALLNSQSAIIAHSGDSRCYRLHGGKCLFRTQDHSLVAELVRKKVMTEEDARLSPQSNVITRGLGNTKNHVPEINEIPYRKGDRFVLCTDGVWGSMQHQELLKAFTQPKDLQQILSDLSARIDQIGFSRGGGHDNHTMAMFELEKDSLLKDAFSKRLWAFFSSAAVLILTLVGLLKNSQQMNRKLNLSILLAFLATCSNSQTVVWQMKPTDYHQIERISNTLFKVERNGKTGLINADGTIVAPVVNNNISDCYEHKALLTANDGHGERITGCLTDAGTYFGFSAKYYTLNGQKFFSDGLLSVADENGKLGYIDERGNPIVGFDGKYSRIKPFTEGHAAVLKNKKYVLINKNGAEIRFAYHNRVGATIAGCTNVFNGKAYVYDEYGGSDRSYFIYDAIKKSDLEKTGRVKNTTMDYLYCYQSVSGRTKEVPFVKMPPYSGKKGLAASQFNGMYGYTTGSSTIVPPQFSSASQFEDGLAIVSIDGQIGILKFVDGASFDVTVPTTKHDFYAGNTVSCSFNLSIPSIWQGKLIDVTLRDRNGSTIPTTNASGTYTFSVKPTASGLQEYSVAVNGEGLRLYERKISYTFNKKERCATCGKDKSQCEYHGNHPHPTTKKEPMCPTCGKKISVCKYQGVH